ncbi:hypothetical protein GDO81_029797 [Engystomops pustulosus]|uniref:Uncharacterized protein n=1 Tax=Engystomops pustulosus TaxID=76066 RepID=A0AAV6YI64_ENGPU|nr:hypothetical protein GDO81_029797 [Engystomops pustulosus]
MPNPSTRQTTHCSVCTVFVTDCPVCSPNNGISHYQHLSDFAFAPITLLTGADIPLVASGHVFLQHCYPRADIPLIHQPGKLIGVHQIRTRLSTTLPSTPPSTCYPTSCPLILHLHTSLPTTIFPREFVLQEQQTSFHIINCPQP